ncbi:MAG: UDP-N-acetylmuramate dehydrogenase [Synergistaceae bacterium]|jgi:UDP-N-acetylmuramate dehydrogenase|nr:UDP-N-acetylmuramate dehydrogenase [Synergistaceae bacterium]
MLWKKKLKGVLSCAFEENRDLSPLSALGVGGRAEVFAEPSRVEDICALFRLRKETGFPLYILGGGTNVVFADGDLEGLVLSTRGLKETTRVLGEDPLETLVSVDAGYLLPCLVRETVLEGLSGLEFAFGIPGTVGGAVAGNAGAGGRSAAELLEEVVTLENDGEIKKWKRADFHYAYRHFSLTAPDRLILRCKLRLKSAPRAEIEDTLARFRSVRSGQPHGERSAGCAFKNPPGDAAGRMLDVCGCKGMRVGGAVVSDSHANFILNANNARGEDIFRLVELCRDIVFQKTGVCLEPEIKFMGFSENIEMT